MLGLLDDLILVPTGLWLARYLIPPDLLAEFRAAADARRPPPSKAAAAAVIAVWLAGAAIAFWAVASVL